MRLLLLAASLLVPLGGWSIYWWQWASAEKTRIEASIVFLNEKFRAAQSRMTLEYRSMEATHLWGRPQIILHDPALVLSAPYAHRIETEWLKLAPEGDSGEQWQVTFAGNFRAERTDRKPASYNFFAAPMPDVWLRTPKAQAAEPVAKGPLAGLAPRAEPVPAGWLETAPHQMAYKLPTSLDLTATQDGKTNTARFNLPSSPLRLWQPMPLRPDHQIDFFFSLLAELVEAHAAKP
jgi:hypothetical protein